MIKYTAKNGPEERNVLEYLSLEKTAFSKRMKLISILCNILGIISTYLAIKSLIHFGINRSDLIMLLISLFLIYLGVDGVKRLKKLYFKKDLTSLSDDKVSTSEYIINIDGVTIIDNPEQTSYKWSVFKKWGEYEHYIYLKGKNDQIILIDKKLLNKNEIKEITTYLKVNIK